MTADPTDAKRLEDIRARHASELNHINPAWTDERVQAPISLGDLGWLLAQLDQLRAEAGPWLRLKAWLSGPTARFADLACKADGAFEVELYRSATDGCDEKMIEAGTIDAALAEAEKRWGDGK